MPSTRGIPLAGDRSAFDTVNYASLHALDIRNLEFVVHVPQPTARLNVPIADDELHWEARLLTEDDISDLTHLDADAIHDNVAHEIDAITELTNMNSLDVILVESAANNYAKRSVVVSNMLTASSIFDLSDVTAVPTPGDGDVLVYDNVNKDWRPGTPSATDTSAVHVNVDDEFVVLDEKSTLVNDDAFIIENSQASGAKAKTTVEYIKDYVEANLSVSGGGAGDIVFNIDGGLAVCAAAGGAFIVTKTMSISAVYIYAEDKGSSGSTIVDVNINGTTAFTTQANRPTLAYDSEDDVIKSATPNVTALTENDVVTIDIDQAATGANCLTVVIAIGESQTALKQTVLTFLGDLEVSDNPLRIYNNLGASQTISKVFLAVGTAPTGASVIVDVHQDGTTIFTDQGNRPAVTAGNATGETTSIDVATWTAGSYLTVHIDQIGSTVAGSDLVVHIIHS